MRNYIVANITNRGEIRISTHKIEGRLIYEGHKLAIPDELLPHIINYTHEKYSGNYNFLNYKKWKDIYGFNDLTSQMTKCWFKERDNKKALMESYETLLETLKEELGDFKKIYIIET